MQHSCSTSVHTSIQYVHVLRACIHMHPPKAPSPKKILGTHACAHKHTCTQLRLFPLKSKKKKLHGAYAHKHLKRRRRRRRRRRRKTAHSHKKIRGRHSRAGTHPCAHTRLQHHKYPNNLMLQNRTPELHGSIPRFQFFSRSQHTSH